MAPVTRITCRPTVLARPSSIVASNAPVTRITCRATVLARPPSIVLYGACHSYYM